MNQEPANNLPNGQRLHAELETCDACGRLRPFTEAIKAGKPLGVVCTCAIEQRAIERLTRQLRLGGPVALEKRA